jgi:protocatechuate 3,4-dioxygenase beta subunit
MVEGRDPSSINRILRAFVPSWPVLASKHRTGHGVVLDMTRTTALLVAALLAVPVAGLAQAPRPGGRLPIDRQMPPRDGRQVEAPRGTSILRGSVVAADSGAPIRRAQVRISGQGVPSRLATTDDRGRFEIKELPSGRYTVTASKGGFVTLQYGQRRPSESGTPLDLGDAQVLDRLVIGLPRGSVIGGRITDEFGEPVANAVVSAMRYGYSAGARRLLPGSGSNSRDTTDDQGQFRLFGLSPGDYLVSAAYRSGGEVTDPAGEPTGYAPTYYPGTPTLADAQRVSVAIGQELTGVTFALVATRLVRVSGAVINAEGQPAMGGMVALVPASARTTGRPAMTQMATTPVDGSGQFRLTNVVPGRYTLHVGSGRGPRAFQGGGAGQFGRAEITVGTDDLDGVVVVTGYGARVSGQVITDTGAAPSIRPQQVQVGARSADPDLSLPGAVGQQVRVNADWSFEINGLFDARYVRTQLPPGWTLKAVLLNGQDITDTPVIFPPGQSVSGMQIVISEKSTTVTGRVTDIAGTAITDATIVVLPADESLWMYQSRFVRTARPDQDGQFQILGLPAYERYLAVPVQGLEDGQAGDPEFLARVRALGTSFSLNEGEARVVDLRFKQ